MRSPRPLRSSGSTSWCSPITTGSIHSSPELTTAWLTSGQDIASASAIAVAHDHAWLHPDRGSALRDLDAGIRAAHTRGLRVDVWTVDDPEEIRTLAEAGVDAIVTNVPDVALAVLR